MGWKIMLLGLVVSHIIFMATTDARIRKLEQQSATGFTVVCAKYKYRETTRNYEGYDCSIFGFTKGEN